MIKAIETVYNGYKFRSRLEARWAVFFDALGIEWQYEVEGFDLEGTWYLPDFWLPEKAWWIEIKPKGIEIDDSHLFTLSAQPSWVILLQGDVWPDEYLMSIYRDGSKAYLESGHFWTWAIQMPAQKLSFVGQNHLGDRCFSIEDPEEGNLYCWPSRYNNYSLFMGRAKNPLMVAYTAARQARFGDNGRG